jgi:hypothetical protein
VTVMAAQVRPDQRVGNDLAFLGTHSFGEESRDDELREIAVTNKNSVFSHAISFNRRS